jgi:hypothetical protein
MTRSTLCTAVSSWRSGTFITMSCFLPIHVYDAATGAPVVVILRPGKTPSGIKVRKLLSRLIGRIRRHWLSTRITIRGDGHCGRGEAITWCENAAVDYILGLPAMSCLTDLSSPPRMISACAASKAGPKCCAALPITQPVVEQ